MPTSRTIPHFNVIWQLLRVVAGFLVRLDILRMCFATFVCFTSLGCCGHMDIEARVCEENPRLCGFRVTVLTAFLDFFHPAIKSRIKTSVTFRCELWIVAAGNHVASPLGVLHAGSFSSLDERSAAIHRAARSLLCLVAIVRCA